MNLYFDDATLKVDCESLEKQDFWNQTQSDSVS